jgi:hypothetical protein
MRTSPRYAADRASGQADNLQDAEIVSRSERDPVVLDVESFDETIVGSAKSFIVFGDVRRALSRMPDGCVRTIVTSPPYWALRDYGLPGQIGLEATLPEYIEALTQTFREVRRVLADDGTFWLNVGDGFTSGNRKWRAPDKKNVARAMSVRPDTPQGLKPKDLLGVPWRLAFAAGGRVVFAKRSDLAQAERDAGEREGPSFPIARVPVPVFEERALLLRL